MKKFISIAFAVLVMALPVLALDPHDVQTSTVTGIATTTTTTPQTVTLTSLTATGINSGTNSYTVLGVATYEVPSGRSCKLQLSKTVSGVTTVLTTVPIAVTGRAAISVSLDTVAASTIFNLQIVAATATSPIRSETATLSIVGLAGATQ